VGLHELALSWLAVQPLVAGIIADASNSDQSRKQLQGRDTGSDGRR
jgi:hypothetical protein